MISYFQKHLFWKFFFSYFALVLLILLILGVIVRFLLPGVFNSHLASMTILLSEHGLETESPMMGEHGRMMMGDSTLFTNLYTIFNQIIFEAVLYAGLSSLIVALFASAIMSRLFVRPLQQMTAVADRIADGDYNVRIPMQGRGSKNSDELGRLAFRFNRMTEQLEEHEELRQKLLGDIAHELRTPLTVIKGTLEGLRDGVLEPEPKTFARIYRQADRLDRLVNDLQELNQIESGLSDLSKNLVEVTQFLRNLVDTLKFNFNQNHIRLHFDGPDEPLIVKADEDRLEQILINLLSNALRYTPEGGDVWVRVAREVDKVEISIQDTGIGIPEEHLPYLFGRFYRVDGSRSRQAGGSGIGLTIAKKLVEAMGGKIWVESPGTGKGATFHFTLPFAEFSSFS